MSLENELKSKIDSLGTAFEQFKNANDASLKQLKEKGVVDPTLTAKVDKANEDISKLVGERDSLAREIESIKTAMNRPGNSGRSNASDELAQMKSRAFSAWMRKGENAGPEFKKALSDDSDPDGGYLVRPELSSNIVKKIFETSPMRQICQVDTIGSDVMDMYSDIDDANAGWTSERGTRTTSATPQIRLIKIPAQELYAEPTATQRQLDDASWDVEKFLAEKTADKFNRVENTAFVGGTGVGQPRGFLTYPSGTNGFGQIEQVVSGSGTTLLPDGLISLFYALKAPYQQNATWLMQRATVTVVRKMKDSQNRYLWEPALIAGNPDLLLGKPLIQAADMPSVAGSALPVAVGDFKKAYQIVDRIGIRVLRDPYTVKGSVLFYTTKRTGGDVVNFEALKLQLVST